MAGLTDRKLHLLNQAVNLYQAAWVLQECTTTDDPDLQPLVDRYKERIKVAARELCDAIDSGPDL